MISGKSAGTWIELALDFRECEGRTLKRSKRRERRPAALEGEGAGEREAGWEGETVVDDGEGGEDVVLLEREKLRKREVREVRDVDGGVCGRGERWVRGASFSCSSTCSSSDE